MTLMRLTLLSMVAGVASFAAVAASETPVDLELILAVDVSRSIDDQEFDLQRRGYAQALTNPRVLDAIHSGPLRAIAVTYVEWSSVEMQKQVVPWHYVNDGETAALFANQILAATRAFSAWTSLSGAIDFAVPLFENNGFEGTRRVIDISGDGINNSGRPANEARDDAVKKYITINGLVIMNERAPPSPAFLRQGPVPLDDFFEKNVVGGPGHFVMSASDFESFANAILNKLIREIADNRTDRALEHATLTTED
jgi:Protein of unknown function (DUF1194)